MFPPRDLADVEDQIKFNRAEQLPPVCKECVKLYKERQ